VIDVFLSVAYSLDFSKRICDEYLTTAWDLVFIILQFMCNPKISKAAVGS